MEQVHTLIESGIVKIGENAKENPKMLDFPEFALGIANKDYQARTPFLWNAVYEHFGFDTRNIRLAGDPENSEVIFNSFKKDRKYLGGDVGVGFKDRAWKIIDEVDPLAREMQAINVVVKEENGILRGYNTDGLGYAQSVKEKLGERGEQIGGKKVVILGGGGTANAISFALAKEGANLMILNRTAAKAEDLAERVNTYFRKNIARFGGRELIQDEVRDADLVISVIDDPTSPLDQYSALGTIELPATPEHIADNLKEAKQIMESMHRETIISDVMLRNQDTATIREAKLAGFSTLDGKPMVLNQAIEAFWLVNQKVLEAKNITKEQVAEVMKQAAGS